MTDEQLIHRWLASMKLAAKGGIPRHDAVSDMFSIMTTAARKVCERHGFDPDEMVMRTG